MGGKPRSGDGKAKRHHAPWWARLALIAGTVLVVLSGGSLGVGAYALHRVDSAVHQDNLLNDGPRHSAGDAVKGPLNILLAGSDLRNSWKADGKLPHADTIMWLHIPASHDRAYLVSIARDLLVSIPPDAHSNFAGSTEKINASFSHGMKNVNDVPGGMKLLGTTVGQVTGMDHFDIAGLVNWDGFTEITQALGGVELCLKEGFTSIQPGFTNTKLTFKAGCHHYDAKTALLLVRQRDNFADTDYGRQQLQQQFIKQLLKQATSKGVVSDPEKLNKVINAAGKSVTLDLGGYSVLNLALALRGITAAKIVTIQPPHHPIGEGDNYQGEALDPDAKDLFTALRTDTMTEYLQLHPDVISKNVPTPKNN